LGTTADSASTELIHKVVLFAILVVVPLGLSLVPPPDRNVTFWLYNIAVALQPTAATLTVVSFFLEKGVTAAAVASGWLIVNIVIALYGVSRLISRGGLFPLAESSIDAGLMYLPVAGGWLVVYRLGVQPFGYGETIILLTVVHFHFAGFAAPIIAGMNGRVLALRDYPEQVFAFSIFAIVAAMPLVAAGITLSPLLGLIGTLLLSAGLILLAVLTIGWVRPAISHPKRQILLIFGALSSCLAMVLASLYAYSLATHTLILTIPMMAMTHGILNAFGFVTCSLFVWSRIAPKELITHKEAQLL
ncbi:MAG TPA: YndJ family protein, partial [Pyrinomonadaceae bacterium]|nr:YndJ family protein [Pyrinomonadaceae bacterium]